MINADDPKALKRLAISLGICPYCKKNLSEPNKDGSRYCYSCHFWFKEEGEQCQKQI